ncbi:Homeodomain-like protein [Baffinella frigidus]|nr:Homeodomain-like protein [Cryptophyta sp. CCMP2293]
MSRWRGSHDSPSTQSHESPTNADEGVCTNGAGGGDGGDSDGEGGDDDNSRKAELKGGFIKGQWTKDEDEKVVQYVQKFGTKQWARIAQVLPGRKGKQCRERWHNHLNPDINKDAWGAEEDALLIEVQPALFFTYMHTFFSRICTPFFHVYARLFFSRM